MTSDDLYISDTIPFIRQGMKISSRADNEPCRFDLESPDQTYHFQAENKVDKDKWMMAISRIWYVHKLQNSNTCLSYMFIMV